MRTDPNFPATVKLPFIEEVTEISRPVVSNPVAIKFHQTSIFILRRTQNARRATRVT